MVIVQVSYNYDEEPSVWEKAYTADRAAMFVDLPGLEWKIWLNAADERRTGGIYCFRDRGSADAYVNGPLLGRHRMNPKISNINVTVSDIREDMSAITRAPVFAQV